MLRVVNLDDNKESALELKALQTLALRNVWLELIDPTDEELHATAEKTGVPKSFLELPETDGGWVNLRLEQEFGIINFVILQDIIATKEVHPIVMAFSKTFLVTVSKGADQGIIKIAKERMSKAKVDPPSQVSYFIIDEIVSAHFVQLERLEDLTSTLEEEVVEKTSSDTLKQIFSLKSNLVSLNKTLWYERGLIFNLRKCGDTCMAAKAR
ncbi:MAG: CorA family divalent cation transporter, partial [Candidatus Bathyarchaeia archaeon]